MKQVEIYTTRFCGFCLAAKRLLAKKNVEYKEIDVGFQPKRRAEMMQRSGGGHTVPQIFIGGRHVGGCDELYELERSGKLNPMLDS